MEPTEKRDGLRSLQIITRDIPTIELEIALESHGWIVEFTGGIMLVTKPVTDGPPSKEGK